MLLKLSPIQRRRFENFRRNRRGYWSLWLFVILFLLSMGAELIANDKPLVISYQDELYFPVAQSIPEETFGGFLPSETNYRDSYIEEEINSNGWMLWPPIRFSYDTVNYDLEEPSPAPPLRKTGWVPTTRPGMWRPGSSTVSGYRCCLA